MRPGDRATDGRQGGDPSPGIKTLGLGNFAAPSALVFFCAYTMTKLPRRNTAQLAGDVAMPHGLADSDTRQTRDRDR